MEKRIAEVPLKSAAFKVS